MQIFLKDCIMCSSELYMQPFSVIDLYMITYEVGMNFKQSRHAFLTKRRMKVQEFCVRLTDN